jgi:putative tricarboxylic transport membrane protein
LISAILIKHPGTPASIATVLRRLAMAKNGDAGKAWAPASSPVCWAACQHRNPDLHCPPIARIALKFGPLNKRGWAFFSLTLISSLISGSVIKGLNRRLFRT